MSSVRPIPPHQDELKAALQKLRGAFITVAIFSGFLNVLMLAPSLYMLQVYDRVLTSRNETTLVFLTLLLVGAFIFMGALEAIRTWVLVRVGARLDNELNARVFNATFERSLMQSGSNATQPIHDLNTLRQPKRRCQVQLKKAKSPANKWASTVHQTKSIMRGPSRFGAGY